MDDLDRREGSVALVRIQGLGVIDGLVLHERYTLALHRSGDDAGGLLLQSLRHGEGAEEVLQIVTVDDETLLAEGAPALLEGTELLDLVDGTVSLESVRVHDGA